MLEHALCKDDHQEAVLVFIVLVCNSEGTVATKVDHHKVVDHLYSSWELYRCSHCNYTEYPKCYLADIKNCYSTLSLLLISDCIE